MALTARGDDKDGLQGETSLMVAVSEEELLDGRVTGSARFSGSDDVALAFTVENQNKGLVSAQMTARGESDDALLLGALGGRLGPEVEPRQRQRRDFCHRRDARRQGR